MSEAGFDPAESKFAIALKGGPWNDLLSAMLATFSQEVVGIATYDNNPVFATVATTTQDT